MANRNAQFLNNIESEAKAAILLSIATRYGISPDEAFSEVIGHEAEHLLDYIDEPQRSATSVLMQRHGYGIRNNQTIDIAKATHVLIGQSAKANDLDAAISLLQSVCGISSGDTAAIFFSEFDGPRSSDGWISATEAERVEILREYLQFELTNY